MGVYLALFSHKSFNLSSEVDKPTGGLECVELTIIH